MDGLSREARFARLVVPVLRFTVVCILVARTENRSSGVILKSSSPNALFTQDVVARGALAGAAFGRILVLANEDVMHVRQA